MLVFYIPVSITGFIVYGQFTKDNIIDNLDDDWLKVSALILITGHLLTAFTIILNPMFQGLEQIFKVPTSIDFFKFFFKGR
jgi:vesicular inhibitory amino acid transporter